MKSQEYGMLVGNLTVPGGVNVLAIRKMDATGARSIAKMDAIGNFIFENLEPGEYFLSSFMSGTDGYKNFR